MTYLFKLIKTINNTDILTLFLDDSDINKLGIKIENSDKNYISTYKLNLMDLDKTIYSIPPTDFTTIITMSTHEFHKICKDLVLFQILLKLRVIKKINIYSNR